MTNATKKTSNQKNISAIYRAVIIFILSFLVFAQFHLNAQFCSVITQPGIPNTEFDSIFTQNGAGTGLEPSGIPGWTGGDSTYSIELPNGDSAFFFSDTYIGEAPAKAGDGSVTTNSNGLRTRQPNCNPPLCNPATNIYRLHNSVVVRNKDTGILKTLTGPLNNGFSTSFFNTAAIANAGHFYWMGDSVVVQTDAQGTKKLWVFLLEFGNNFDYYGSAIAQLSLPSMQIESIQPLLNPPASPTNWGSALYLQGGYGNYTLYIYGNNAKKPYLAKTSNLSSLSNAANMQNWTYWNGANFNSNFSNAVPIIGRTGDPKNASDLISDEFSVKKIHTLFGDAFFLVGMDTTVFFGEWKDITLYTSCSPQGPFSAKKVVYRIPESGSNRVPGMTAGQTLSGNMFTYNPHIHPQFTRKGRLLISYNINAGRSADLLFADTYRPRFISVPIRGLRKTY